MPEAQIDPEVFSELEKMAGPEFARELVQTFGEEAPVMLSDLRDALAKNEGERYRRAAHSLKSNSLTFGAMRLGAMAKAIEAGGIEASTPATLDELEAEYARVAAALKALCDV